MAILYYETELYHHGTKGQKWGVKNGPPYPLKNNSNNATITTNLNRFKTLKLSKKEYGKVMHELQTNISAIQRKHDIVYKCIGDYKYTFENNHDGTFRPIRRRKIK